MRLKFFCLIITFIFFFINVNSLIVLKKIDGRNFLYDLDNEKFTMEELASDTDSLIGEENKNRDYNFGSDGVEKGYLKNDNCELNYSNDNILNANWSGKAENIFGFLKGKNEKLAKDILKANLMMKVQVNYTYNIDKKNNYYIYVDNDGVDLNEIKRNLRKDLLQKEINSNQIKITSFQANDSKCNFNNNGIKAPPLNLDEDEYIDIKFPNFQIATENKNSKEILNDSSLVGYSASAAAVVRGICRAE